MGQLYWNNRGTQMDTDERKREKRSRGRARTGLDKVLAVELGAFLSNAGKRIMFLRDVNGLKERALSFESSGSS
jgi:hypothetical protein